MGLAALSGAQRSFLTTFLNVKAAGDGETAGSGAEAWDSMQRSVAPRVDEALKANHPEAGNIRASWAFAQEKAEAGDQRRWLKTALTGKGKIRSAGIKKQFENYKRRREKVEVVFKDLPASHSNYLFISSGLTAADTMAKAADFKGAYKSLDKVKALAKATDSGASGGILENEIRQSAQLIRKLVDAQREDIDRFFALVDTTLRRFTDLEPCSAKQDMAAGLEHRKVITAMEPDLRGAVDAVGDAYEGLLARINDRKISQLVTDIAKEFDLLTKAGHDDIVQRHTATVEGAKALFEGTGGKYRNANPSKNAYKTLQVDAEKMLLARKSLDAFAPGEQDQDALTRGVQAGLEKQDVFQMLDALLREEERLERARQEYLAEVERDRAALAKTGAVGLQLTPEPPEFDVDDVLDDITLDPNGKLKDAERKQAADEAGHKMTAILTDPATPQSVLLDLMAKDQTAIANQLFEKLYPGLDWNDASGKQQDLIREMSKEMFDNPKRKHTNNGMLSPVDFEARQQKLNGAGV